MLILLISVLLCIALVLAGSILIITKQQKKREDELLRLSETAFTAVMGGMAAVLGFFLLYAKYTDHTVAGSDTTSYFFIGGFAVICVGIGCGILLYTFLKKIIVFNDRILYVTIFGRHKEIYWNKISELRIPFMSNKVTIIGKNTRFTVGGETKAYKKFIKIAKEKIITEVGSDVLEKLSGRFLF